MREEIVAALAILERAIRIEQEGREFYLKAAQTTEEEKGRETFRTLASDEQNHLDLIKKQRQSLSDQSQWIIPDEIKPAPVDLQKTLFPKGREALKKAIGAKSGESDALVFGLEIESKSYDFYRQAASEITDHQGKAMFQFLAGEEKQHFDTLMMRYDFLFGPIAWTS
ncbi:MAG: ferritin family protein [Dehalococcoidales bacterium]|nr:ferritin family protein [Dehalococcoidales bacterium]